MASGRERILRRRIKSVQSTKKITRAMELIAASRIVRAQQAIAAARPYVTQMRKVVADLGHDPDGQRHPLFRQPEETRRAAIVAITADRGLAGAYNSSVIRTTERLIRQYESGGIDVMLVTTGKKAQNYFRYRGRSAESFLGFSERPTFSNAREVAAVVMRAFEEGEVDTVNLVYTRFLSLGSQQVTTRQLIPLLREDIESGVEEASSSEDAGGTIVYEFEPDPEEIVEKLLPSWVEAELLVALLEGAASEQAARQRAMKAATDNADDLITRLTRVMNRARQDAITTEIMEIVGGAEALRAAGRAEEAPLITHTGTAA
ncbi:MAG TPA: F0F1 ATP synthase subunit gamma [Acidimicrobiales bacterium]|nr:F0F1 ATP synthase subunit gamma [Acidimicrobiales bacterium]